MTPADSQIQDVADSNPLGRLDARENRNPVGGSSQELCDQAVFAPGAVLEVDEEPVETREGAHFGCSRRSQVQERAARTLAGAHALAQRHDTDRSDGARQRNNKKVHALVFHHA